MLFAERGTGEKEKSGELGSEELCFEHCWRCLVVSWTYRSELREKLWTNSRDDLDGLGTKVVGELVSTS